MLSDYLEREFGLESIPGQLENGANNSKMGYFHVCLRNAKLAVQDCVPAEIPGLENVFIGSIGSAYNFSALADAGITHILCLSEIIRLKYPQHFVYRRVSFSDRTDCNLLDYLDDCFAFARECEEQNGRLLVHCYQGVSRSAAVCAAFLIRRHACTPDEALERIRSVRPSASPNPGFLSTLHDFYQQELQSRETSISSVN